MSPKRPNKPAVSSRKAGKGSVQKGRVQSNPAGKGGKLKKVVQQHVKPKSQGGVSKIAGYEHVVATSPALSSFRQLAASDSSNQNEIKFKITDFFDYSPSSTGGAVLPYWFDLTQDLVGDTDEGSDTLIRPERVQVWVLPRARNADVAASTFVALTGVRAKAPGGGTTVLANSQNTVVQPDFNIKWRKVLDWKADDLFRNTEIAPVVSSRRQDLFRMQCIDADDGDTTTEAVQVRVEIDASQVIPLKNVIEVDSGTYVGSWNADSTPTVTKSFAMIQPLSLANRT